MVVIAIHVGCEVAMWVMMVMVVVHGLEARLRPWMLEKMVMKSCFVIFYGME